MSHSRSKKVILVALIANFLIACTKFAAAAITLSSSMLSEGIHSLVDVGNQALLMFGLRQANRKADKEHPFGYGKEIYFWSFIVAILLFALGGGLSIYEGINHWLNPTPIQHVFISYIVLLFAFIFEFTAWIVALRAFSKTQNGRHFFQSIHRAKDPALIVVLLEDSAAIIGLTIALGGVSISHLWQLPRVDAIASLMIGAVLLAVSTWLAYESKHLLIGESADATIVRKIKSIIRAHTNIQFIERILTMHIGPEDILVNLYVDFIDNISSQQVEDTITELEWAIKKQFPQVEWVYIAAKSFSRRKNRPKI